MKLAIYTCITNNYDSILPMARQNSDVDFVCFTDNPSLQFKTSQWNFRKIPSELLNLSPVKQQRIIKICPHKYLKDYDASLWIDGNIQIVSDISKFLKQYDLNQFSFWTKEHPSRNCVYKEAEEVIKRKKDFPENVKSQINEYKLEGFPENFGLHETSVIYRKHNETNCQILDNFWAQEILKHSHRDQLSFDYCRWKLNSKIGHLQIGNLLKDKNFRWRKHGK